jgi:hypothetical protein
MRQGVEWERIQALCGTKIRVCGLRRVRNNFLRSQYEGRKLCIEAINGESGVNERSLFHGTSRWDPKVLCLSNQGFDPRVSNDGFYGQGVYFAETANYSHMYAHRSRGASTSAEIFEFILATVACGVSKDYDRRVDSETRGLRRPPPRDSQGVSGDGRFGGRFLVEVEIEGAMEMGGGLGGQGGAVERA